MEGQKFGFSRKKVKESGYNCLLTAKYLGDDNCYYEKTGKNEPVKLEDLPFDIPDNWTWIRLKDIIQIQTGASFRKEQSTQEARAGLIRVLRGGNILPFQYLLKDDDLYIPKELVSNNILLKKNDLITPAVTSLDNIGKIAVIDVDLSNTTAGGFVYIFRPYINDDVMSNLIADFISSLAYQSMMKNIAKKSGQAFYNMNKEKLLQLYFPIAPLNEMRRIIEKVNKFVPLVIEYSITEERLSKLEEEFPEKLKKSILQYAIEGKLVKQDPNDEPASVLLERIKAEKERLIKEGKIKRDKSESYIYQGDDKNYYEKIGSKMVSCEETTQINLPCNWSFCYFGNISTYGFTTTKFQHTFNSWLLELEDITSGSLVVKTRKYIDEKTNLNSKVAFKAGMILYSKLRPYLDKIVFADQDGVATSEIVPFYSLVDAGYLITFLRSPYFLSRVNNLMYGVKMPRLGTRDMTMTIVPLPPLLEQKRIVEKVLLISRTIIE